MSETLKMRRTNDGAIIPVSRKAWENIYSKKPGFELVTDKEKK